MKSIKCKSTDNLEGKLFVFIMKLPSMSLKSMGYWKDYYTVKDGIVYHCEGKNKLFTLGDSLETLINSCRMVGDYNPDFDYKCELNRNKKKLKYN